MTEERELDHERAAALIRQDQQLQLACEGGRRIGALDLSPCAVPH